MLQILHKTNIDFMGWKNISFTVSAIFIALGLVALFQVGRGKANMGIDFVGGTTVQLSFTEHLPIDEARAALDKGGFQGYTIQEFAEGNKILVRLREHEGAAEKTVAVPLRESRNFFSARAVNPRRAARLAAAERAR